MQEMHKLASIYKFAAIILTIHHHCTHHVSRVKINGLDYLVRKSKKNGEWRIENGEWRMENGGWGINDELDCFI